MEMLEAESHLDSVLENCLKLGDQHPSISGKELHIELRRCLRSPPLVSTYRVNTLKYTRDNAQEILLDLISKQKRFQALSFSIMFHPLIDDMIAIENHGPRCELVQQVKKVIVGIQCGNSVLRGSDVYVPGVLGAPRALTKGDYVSVYSDIDRKCLQGMSGVYAGSTMFVGNGYSMVNRDELFGQHRLRNGVAVTMDDALYVSPSFSSSELQDVLFLQNLPSVVVAHVLDPQPGERVLDMCAAPGGKTVHIATLMKDKGEVIALDKSSPKVTKLQENVRRFNLNCVLCFKFDATKALATTSIKEADRGSPPYMPNSFDRVLVDAPCSALGQRPQPNWVLGLKDLQSYPCYQKMIIKQAIGLLKVGGTLVYSTCTYSPEENECQVKWILDEFKNMSLESQKPSVGYPGLPGFGLSDEELAKVQRFWPKDFAETLNKHIIMYKHREGDKSVLLDSIGFFIAKFIKVC